MKKKELHSSDPKGWTINTSHTRDIHKGKFVEATCQHGVGHHKGVHGCDGCCSGWPEEISKQVTTER